MNKPVIWIALNGDVVHWVSHGWHNDPDLMAAARKAIHDGEDFAGVQRNLREHFVVGITSYRMIERLMS